ncbi:MAG TPA: LLM class flavin-dependent oxidoreductase [Mycobacterium sp.]|nr:LLM class flavin-dependent oxidoreductase [Mycobacterium sp.]
MTAFRVGLLDMIIAGRRPAADAFTRMSYFSALAMRADSFWVPDHLNSIFPQALWQPKYCGAAKIQPSADAAMEPWTMLGNIAARNRIARLPLGLGVTDAGRRNPAVTAQAAATVNLLNRGRFILGIGPGEREGNEPYGVDWSKPVGRFEEAMATIRALWDSKGKLVNRDSAFFPLRNAVFDLPPYKGRWPQIWIGAHGPRMLRAVGRYADGYFPAFPHTPAEYARRLETVRAAASDAGRDPMAIVPAILMPILTGRSRDEVDEALGSDALKTAALSASDEFFAQHGAQHPLGVGFSGGQDLLPQTMDEQTVLSHVKGVTPAILRAMMLTGTPDEVLEQAAHWRDCGVRHMVAGNLSFMQPSLRNGIASTVPFFQIMRRLKKL